MACESNYLRYDFSFNRGATPQWQMTYADADEVAIDLTGLGYEARMVIRLAETAYDLDQLAESFLAEWTTENGKLELTDATGVLVIRADIDDIEELNADNAFVQHLYQLEFYIPGTPDQVIPLLEGTVTVHPEVPNA